LIAALHVAIALFLTTASFLTTNLNHYRSDGTKHRRNVSFQEAKRMLADIVAQSRSAAASGGCTGATGPSSQLPS
jgi:hypothetical protein